MQRTNEFGQLIRSLRLERNYGVRELARLAGMSAAFLSKIERSGDTPPSEGKILALAHALSVEPDRLLALSGRVPSELVRIIRRHPREYLELLRATDGLPSGCIEEIRKFAASLARGEESVGEAMRSRAERKA